MITQHPQRYILFRNEGNFYTAAKFEVNDEKGRVISVTGNIPEIIPGIQYRINGNYIEHPRYGMQFQILCSVCFKLVFSASLIPEKR